MKRFLLLLLLVWLSIRVDAQNATVSKEQVIAQMNYCINSITNVVQYKSMPLLEHEIDQLLNNLTMKQVVDLPKVQSFRSNMLEEISKLQITEEEKIMMRRVQELKRENMLYQSISNALSPTMLLTGGGKSGPQLAFMAVMTAARAAVEYKTASNEADIEELQVMWQFRKNDLESFASLRKEALELVFELFQNYGLDESDRLTEQTSMLLSQIISEEDPYARVRKLLDNRKTYEAMADYYYYLGMAYVDADQYSVGKDFLDRYLEMYRRAPIFRYDEKTGCVALTKLALEEGLSNYEVVELVRTAVGNLPNNGPAIIQSVLVLNRAGEREKAYNLLRLGIDNDLVSDKDALVMLATKLLPDMLEYPLCREQVIAAVNHCKGLSVNSFIPFLLASSREYLWEDIESVIRMNEDGQFVVDSKYTSDISSVKIQREHIEKDAAILEPCEISYSNAISWKTIRNKFKSIRSNPDVTCILFDHISRDFYRVRPNLDYQKIKDGDYKGLGLIKAKSRKRIAKFCKKEDEKSGGKTSIVFWADKSSRKQKYDAVYADVLLKDSVVNSVDISMLKDIDEISGAESCKVKTRENRIPVPLFKNGPEDLIRLVLPGVDTVQICYDAKSHSLYSVSFNGMVFFEKPYHAVMPDDGKPKKDNPVKKIMRKRQNFSNKVTKTVLPDSLDETIDSIYSRTTFVSGVWHTLIKKKKTDDPEITEQQTTLVENGDSSDASQDKKQLRKQRRAQKRKKKSSDDK